MTIDKILVLIFSGIGIGFTYWFFLMKKDTVVEAGESIDILVEGGYTPSVISIRKGKTTILNFIRKDANTCLEEVILSDFKIKKQLPFNQKVSIALTPTKTGEFSFSCGMNMFHGKIIVQ